MQIEKDGFCLRGRHCFSKCIPYSHFKGMDLFFFLATETVSNISLHFSGLVQLAIVTATAGAWRCSPTRKR